MRCLTSIKRVRLTTKEPNYREFLGAFTAAGSLSNVYNQMLEMDLTDGAGHGLLLATNSIFMQGDTTLFTPAVAVFDCKMLYRFKTVDILEYVGIVQSQS